MKLFYFEVELLNKQFCYVYFRDTPHHLKNKRVQHNLPDKNAHEILANALNQEKKLQHLSSFQSPIAENPVDEKFEQEQSKPKALQVSGGQQEAINSNTADGKCLCTLLQN